MNISLPGWWLLISCKEDFRMNWDHGWVTGPWPMIGLQWQLVVVGDLTLYWCLVVDKFHNRMQFTLFGRLCKPAGDLMVGCCVCSVIIGDFRGWERALWCLEPRLLIEINVLVRNVGKFVSGKFLIMYSSNYLVYSKWWKNRNRTTFTRIWFQIWRVFGDWKKSIEFRKTYIAC